MFVIIRVGLLLLLSTSILLIPFKAFEIFEPNNAFILDETWFWIRVMSHCISAVLTLEIMTWLPFEKMRRQRIIFRKNNRDTFVMIVAISALILIATWPLARGFGTRSFLIILGGIAFVSIITISGSDELKREVTPFSRSGQNR